MRLNRISIFVAVCLVSCTNSFEESTPSRLVNGKTLIQSELLLDPWKITLVDSILIIGNLQGEPLLQLFDLKSNSFVKQTLSKGRGPLEVMAIGNIQSRLPEKTFYVFDLLGKKMLQYQLDKLLTSNSYYPDLVLDLSEFSEINSEAVNIVKAEDKIIGTSVSPEGMVFVLNTNDNSTKFRYATPSKNFINEHLSDKSNAYLYSSGISLSPDGRRIGTYTFHADMISLSGITSNGIDSIMSNYKSYPNDIIVMPGYSASGEQVFFSRQSILYYLDGVSSDKFFYALYCGNNMEEQNYDNGNRIMVFSWTGKFIEELRLNRLVKRIAVDNSDNILCGVSMNEFGEPEIVFFDLQGR